jgi:hypothetical protein
MYHFFVIPAKAGIQTMDSSLRWNDAKEGVHDPMIFARKMKNTAPSRHRPAHR